MEKFPPIFTFPFRGKHLTLLRGYRLDSGVIASVLSPYLPPINSESFSSQPWVQTEKN